MNAQLPKIDILGVGITSRSNEQILEYIEKILDNKDEKVFISTPNPEIIVYANRHQEYRDIINSSQIALPDGTGVVLASYILSKSLRMRITGVDFVESLCEKLSKRHVSIGFLGGRGGVAKKTAECLKRKYPGITIAFTHEEWPEDTSKASLKNPKFESKSKNYFKYNEALMKSFPKADILFVAYGFPKQEQWIYENLPHIPVQVAMAVGGTFDYLSGSVSRAPFLIRLFGFEWLYRLIKQPWRWRRQLALFEFVIRVFRRRFFHT